MAVSKRMIRVTSLLGALAALSLNTTLASRAFAAEAAKSEVNPRSAVAASVEVPEEKNWFAKFGNRLGSIDISLKVPLLDVELLRGLQTSLDYRYETEPSYTGEYHFRKDRGTLRNELNVGELLNRTNSYVGLQLNHNAEILFVRPHQTKNEALTAFPFGFDHMPKSAKEVASRFPFIAENVKFMKPGDFFSFIAHLDLIASAASLPIAPGRLGQIYTHYLISGQYQIYMVKGDDDKLFLKVVALRKNQKVAGVRIGLWEDYRILGLKVVDRRISNIANLTEMFKSEASKTDANIFAVDYELDMKDARVQDAFDGLAAKVLKLKSIAIGNPLQSIENLTDTLISDITPFDAIFTEDRLKPIEMQAVKRSFEGKDDVLGDASNIKFAPIFFSYSKAFEYYENVLTFIAADGTVDYHRLHTFQRTKAFSIFWSYFKGVGISRASLLYNSGPKSSDDKGAEHPVKELQNVLFDWNYRDKSLSADEMAMIRNAVKQAVPASINRTVNWGVFAADRGFENARFSYKMVLDPSALTELKSMTEQDFMAELKRYVPTIPTPTTEPSDKNQKLSDGANSVMLTFFDTHNKDLQNIAYRLAQFVDKALSPEVRARAFAELRFNELFIEIAPGFLLSLLDQTKLEQLVRFEITMVADDVTPMTPFVYPTAKPGKIIASQEDREVYKAAASVLAILTANEFDTLTQMLKTARVRALEPKAK